MADNKNTDYQGFTLSLALVDAVPVLLFGASMILIGLIYGSALFIIGAVLAFLAGFLKVLWKIIVAVKDKDVKLLNKQFRYLMIGGWLLMLISLIVGIVNGSVSGKAMLAGITGLPQLVFFILSLCGFIGMGILGKKLDPTKARSNWIEECDNIIAQLCLFIGLLIITLR